MLMQRFEDVFSMYCIHVSEKSISFHDAINSDFQLFVYLNKNALHTKFFVERCVILLIFLFIFHFAN